VATTRALLTYGTPSGSARGWQCCKPAQFLPGDRRAQTGSTSTSATLPEDVTWPRCCPGSSRTYPKPARSLRFTEPFGCTEVTSLVTMRLNVDQMLQTTPASRLTAAIKRSRSDHLRALNSPVAGLLDPLTAPRLALRLTRDNQGVYLEDLCVSVWPGPGWRSPC